MYIRSAGHFHAPLRSSVELLPELWGERVGKAVQHQNCSVHSTKLSIHLSLLAVDLGAWQGCGLKVGHVTLASLC